MVGLEKMTQRCAAQKRVRLVAADGIAVEIQDCSVNLL
jgi:hypothetical protein